MYFVRLGLPLLVDYDLVITCRQRRQYISLQKANSCYEKYNFFKKTPSEETSDGSS
jgi:hypothetical protein